jgi:hypothetical protein
MALGSTFLKKVDYLGKEEVQQSKMALFDEKNRVFSRIREMLQWT